MAPVVPAGVIKQAGFLMAVVPAGVTAIKQACLLYGCSSCWNYSHKSKHLFMAVVPAGTTVIKQASCFMAVVPELVL